MESKYSIKDLEHLTGVRAHTIRVWEQRYQLVEPERTCTNIRYYKDADLKRLLNVSVLVHSGMKISKVAAMTDAERNALVIETAKYTGDYSTPINGLKMAMLNFNEDAFNRILTNAMVNYGTEETFTNVVGGFVQQIGLLWQTNTISITHEHFASNLIKQKLFVAIDNLMANPLTEQENQKTYLLYLPSDELHELGLLYINYILRNRGHRVIYLGQSVPLDYLSEVLSNVEVDHLVSVCTTSPCKDDISSYLDSASEILKKWNLTLHCSGKQVTHFCGQEERSGIFFSKDVLELSQALQTVHSS